MNRSLCGQYTVQWLKDNRPVALRFDVAVLEMKVQKGTVSRCNTWYSVLSMSVWGMNAMEDCLVCGHRVIAYVEPFINGTNIRVRIPLSSTMHLQATSEQFWAALHCWYVAS